MKLQGWFKSMNKNMHGGIKAFPDVPIEEKIRANNVMIQQKSDNYKKQPGQSDKYTLLVEQNGTDFFILTAMVGQKREIYYNHRTKEKRVYYVPLLRFPLELASIIGNTYMVSFQRIDKKRELDNVKKESTGNENSEVRA